MIRHSLKVHPWEMQQFIDPNLLDRLRVGPLAAYLDTYLKRIEQAGFLRSSVSMQMYAIARFSNWLHFQQVNLRLMDEATIQQFLKRDQYCVSIAVTRSNLSSANGSRDTEACSTCTRPSAISRLLCAREAATLPAA